MQTNQADFSVSLGDLDLPFKASSIMDYHDAVVLTVGDRIVVGYLSDDSDCGNPMEDWDGQGKLFSAHRWSNTHSEMQAALALDSDWSRDLGLVDDHKPRLRLAWIEKAMDSAAFQVWAEDTAGARASLSPAYYKRRARKLWDETDGEYNYRETSVQDFECFEDARDHVWEELRSEGLIGDKDVVSLDCYEHGGQSWSVSGEGMQCRFDTANGGGVWVPDDSARAEVDRRAKVYAFGVIEKNGSWTRASGKLRFTAVLDDAFGALRSEEFAEWHEAFAWLESKSKRLRLARRQADRAMQDRRGRGRAAREIAREALGEYNTWLSGNCYGIVAATFTNVAGTGEEPEWEFVESDECWGFIGDDYAMEEASSNAKAVAASLQKKAA